MSEAKDAGYPNSSHEVITLAGGCFWCIEAAFNLIRGVEEAESGYAGGDRPNPSYEQVCTGTTGHAEVVRVTFDPAIISLAEILDVFFAVHDPTTLNRQGPDVGTQYRSAIFYHSEEQKQAAEKAIAELEAEGTFDAPIVTVVTPLKAFYKAEEYHQRYYERNSGQPYCRAMISPKLAKVRKLFGYKLAT